MGRSQRHKVLIQNTDSAGKGLSEKQPAPVYINQFANSQAFTVPTGAPGGPLQGSSMAGFPPTLIPLPGLKSERGAELQAEGAFTEPGQFNLSGNPVYESLPPADGSGGGPEPEPANPVIDSLDPNTAELGSADVTMRVLGSNFDEGSTIYFAEQPEPIVFVSENEITTGVKPSLGWGAVTVQVAVQKSDDTVSNEMPFTFTEAAPEAESSGGRQTSSALPLPEGPVAIVKIEKAGKNILITVDAPEFRTGDAVRIEATGNSSINGDYDLGTVKDATITIDGEDIDLLSPIENRGRITLLERP